MFVTRLLVRKQKTLLLNFVTSHGGGGGGGGGRDQLCQLPRKAI